MFIFVILLKVNLQVIYGSSLMFIIFLFMMFDFSASMSLLYSLLGSMSFPVISLYFEAIFVSVAVSFTSALMELMMFRPSGSDI